MYYLGTTTRVVYEAKNRTIGLGNISAMVVKPDGSELGPYALAPMPGGVYFAGLYSFNLPTSSSDPEGSWYVSIYSADEVWGDVKELLYVKNPVQSLQPLFDAITVSIPPGFADTLAALIASGLFTQQITSFKNQKTFGGKINALPVVIPTTSPTPPLFKGSK